VISSTEVRHFSLSLSVKYFHSQQPGVALGKSLQRRPHTPSTRLHTPSLFIREVHKFNAWLTSRLTLTLRPITRLIHLRNSW